MNAQAMMFSESAITCPSWRASTGTFSPAPLGASRWWSWTFAAATTLGDQGRAALDADHRVESRPGGRVDAVGERVAWLTGEQLELRAAGAERIGPAAASTTANGPAAAGRRRGVTEPARGLGSTIPGPRGRHGRPQTYSEAHARADTRSPDPVLG